MVSALIIALFWNSVVAIICMAHRRSTTREEFFENALKSRENFPILNDSAAVDIYYLEFVLATWSLDGVAWNAYHSGIGFIVQNKDGSQRKLHAEFIPWKTETISHVLHPTITRTTNRDWLPEIVQDAITYLSTDYSLHWQNEGGLYFTDDWPEKYKNVTKIGTTTGTIFNKMRPWFFAYQDENRWFEPFEMVHVSNGSIMRPSTLCHDLFYHALYQFYHFGFRPNPERPIFRDHVLVFVSESKDADLEESKFDITRYFRLYESFTRVADLEFTNLRALLLATYVLQMPMYALKQGKYIHAVLSSPYINYCYMEIVMPPGAMASYGHSEKICGLDLDLSSNDSSWSFLNAYRLIHVLYVAEAVLFSKKSWFSLAALLVSRHVIRRFRKPRNQ